MSDLTKEYFDQALKTLVTIDTLASTEKRIIKRIDDAQEELARITADTIAIPFTKRFDRLEELLEVKQDVLTLKREMLEIRAALHLSN